MTKNLKPIVPIIFESDVEESNQLRGPRTNSNIDPRLIEMVKQEIIKGTPENELVRIFKINRGTISNIRHGVTHRDIGGELPEIKKNTQLTPELADRIGYLLFQNKPIKEISEISGVCENVVLDVKRGEKYPEIKEKYNLTDVKVYNSRLDDKVIAKEVIPAILSGKYHNDQEVADVFGCSSAQIRDLRLHKRRTHLTEGVDFNDCYSVSTGKKTHVLTPPAITTICEFIQDNPNMSYDDIVRNLSSSIPNITCKLCQDIKLRRTHRDISDYYVW